MRYQPLRKSKQFQQFRALSKKLGSMVDNGSFYQLSRDKQVELRRRLANLYRQVAGVFSNRRLRRTLASAAILIGLASSAQAQSFAAPVTTNFGLTTENTPIFHFADIDNDGDPDAFMSIYDADGDRTFAWQENTGTADAPAFGDVVENPFNITLDELILNVDLADVDNDGDLDLFMGTYNFDGEAPPILGWQNFGTATDPLYNIPDPAENPFSLDPSDEGVAEVVFVDLDGDGDKDVIMNDYTDFYANEDLRYQENLGANPFPTFSAVQIDPFGLANTGLDRAIINAGDLDEDGDNDLMVAGRVDIDAYLQADFVYYENTGTATEPAFAPTVTNPFDLEVPANTYILIPAYVDMDGDGDIDIVATTYDSNTYEEGFLYFENLGMNVNTEEVSAINQSAVFPTLAVSTINWEARLAENVRNASFQVVDQNGRAVLSQNQDLISGFNQGTIAVDQLASGMYILQIANEQGTTQATHRFFVK